mmetsp:Transcript_96194/g.200940  ORF Transcript_96194/g.200940 Transcript_96194/m.200940 type:complete len:275 (+) Transcript_96194:188-1012(+)
MQHLKECPWDGGQGWRPARLQLATTDAKHRADLGATRNYVQHQQPRSQLMKPMGLEETIRKAVRAGHWPTAEEAKSACFLPGGFEEFQQTGCSTLKGSTLASTSWKALEASNRDSAFQPGLLASKYNLMPSPAKTSRDYHGGPINPNRSLLMRTHTGLSSIDFDSPPGSAAPSRRVSVQVRSRASSDVSTVTAVSEDIGSPFANAPHHMAQTFAPSQVQRSTFTKCESAPDLLGGRNSLRSPFVSRRASVPGLQGIIASGRAAGDRTFSGHWPR